MQQQEMLSTNFT